MLNKKEQEQVLKAQNVKATTKMKTIDGNKREVFYNTELGFLSPSDGIWKKKLRKEDFIDTTIKMTKTKLKQKQIIEDMYNFDDVIKAYELFEDDDKDYKSELVYYNQFKETQKILMSLTIDDLTIDRKTREMIECVLSIIHSTTEYYKNLLKKNEYDFDVPHCRFTKEELRKLLGVHNYLKIMNKLEEVGLVERLNEYCVLNEGTEDEFRVHQLAYILTFCPNRMVKQHSFITEENRAKLSSYFYNRIGEFDELNREMFFHTRKINFDVEQLEKDFESLVVSKYHSYHSAVKTKVKMGIITETDIDNRRELLRLNKVDFDYDNFDGALPFSEYKKRQRKFIDKLNDWNEATLDERVKYYKTVDKFGNRSYWLFTYLPSYMRKYAYLDTPNGRKTGITSFDLAQAQITFSANLFKTFCDGKTPIHFIIKPENGKYVYYNDRFGDMVKVHVHVYEDNEEHYNNQAYNNASYFNTADIIEFVNNGGYFYDIIIDEFGDKMIDCETYEEKKAIAKEIAFSMIYGSPLSAAGKMLKRIFPDFWVLKTYLQTIVSIDHTGVKNWKQSKTYCALLQREESKYFRMSWRKLLDDKQFIMNCHDANYCFKEDSNNIENTMNELFRNEMNVEYKINEE